MTKKLNIDIIAKDKSKQALNQVQGNLAKTKKSVLNLRNALIGLGAGLALRSVINVGKEVENLQVRFKFLFGSVEEGKIAFDNLSKFAAKVPFSLGDIAAASGNLGVVAKDAKDLTRILEITGNVAAFTGLDFQTTASQIQRAFSGGIAAADIFREKGLRQILGFEAGAKVSIEETIKAFEKTFGKGGKLGKVTDDLAQTLTGTVSMLQDELFNFQKLIAEQFIGTLTDELGDLKTFLEQNKDEIQEIAVAIGETLANAILILGKAFNATREVYQFLDRPIKDIVLELMGFGETAVSVSGDTANLSHNIEDMAESFDKATISLEKFKDNAELSNTFKIVPAQGEDIFEQLKKIREKTGVGLINQIKAQKRQELETLKDANDLGLLTDEEFLKQKEKLNQIYEDRITRAKENEISQRVKLEKQAQDEIIGLTGSALKDLSGLNRTAFRAYQAFQIGQAIINAHATASRVMAQYAGLFPLNIAMAGAAYAAGAARVAAIRSAPAPRISGGRVNAGEPYMVGEAGREMFVPQQSGTIVPNNQLTSPNVNITIMANDTEGFDDLLLKRRSVIVNVINDALNTQGKEALI